MWPLASIGDKIMVSFVGKMFGQRILNTFNYRIESIDGPDQPTDDVLDELFNVLDEPGSLINTYLVLAPSNYNLDFVWAQTVERSFNGDRLAKRSYFKNSPGGGGVASSAITQIAITRKGVVATRSAIGGVRVPVAGVAANAVDGLWQAGVKALAETFAEQMITQYTLDLTTTLIDVQPIINNGTGAANYTPLFETEVHDEVRTQRTRVVGRGE